MEQGISRTTCPECSETLQQEGSELLCRSCGFVEQERIDHGPEWRSGETDPGAADGKRTGAPMTSSRHDKGLSTKIGFGTGAEVSGDRQRQFVRMRRQHNRARLSSKADRNRVYAFTEIRRLVSQLSLPESLREQSCSLFESAQSEDLLCGRSLEGFAAAAVYATCRARSVSRTMSEIVSESRATRNELKTAYDALNRELGLPVGPIDPTEYLPRFATELDLDAEIERRAREYAVLLKESGRISGKNPSGVAAACLYAATLEAEIEITQIETANLADVSRMTIRSTVSDIEAL